MKTVWSFAIKIVPLLQIRKSFGIFFVLTYHPIFHFTFSYQSVAPAICIMFSFG